MNNCPFCKSENLSCGTLALQGEVNRSATCRNREAVAFCQRHEHPGVVTAVHEFARQVREILAGEVRSHA